MPYPAVATTPHRPRAAPLSARIAGATPGLAEVASEPGKAHEWHRSPKARAILAQIGPADVRRDKADSIWGSLFDKTELRPLSEAAWDAYERLKALRIAAVDAELGHTFAATQSPYNEARATRWLDLYASVPEVAEVVAEELAGRKAGEGRAV